MGEKRGRVCQGTCMKDPWPKPQGGRIEGGRGDGWSGGKWWQENGDNCTRTTIF